MPGVMPLFDHPELARFKAVLQDSPTAVKWLHKMEKAPVALEIGTPQAENVIAQGMRAAYVDRTRTVCIPHEVIAEADRSPAGDAEDVRFQESAVASVLLHEGVHSVQFKQQPAEVVVAKFFIAPVLDTARGVSNLATGHYGGSGVAGRFFRGVNSRAVGHELEAYRVQGSYYAETGRVFDDYDGLLDAGHVASDRQIMDGIMQYPQYRPAIVKRYLDDALAALAVGTVGGTALIVNKVRSS